MKDKIKTVAFDLGNVLATRDYSKLNEQELALLKAYLNRFDQKRVLLEAKKVGINNPDIFLEEAKKQMHIIYPKIHVMHEEGIKAVQNVKNKGLTPSIWTNNIWEINNWFSIIGLYDLISPEYICNSIAMGNGSYDKPHLQFFKLALQQIKCNPQEVLFIDDSKKNVDAGLASGIPSIQYDLNFKENLSDVLDEAIERYNHRR